MIYLDRPSLTINKTPHGDENKDDIAIEKRIYERFSERGGHEGLLHYHRSYETGIRLEFASTGNLRTLLKGHREKIDIEQQLRWAKQITDTLRYIHSVHVIHGGLNTRLSDFGGSSLDGSPLLVAVTASHRSPGPTLSTQGDIFALGSTLYELMTGYVPYHELEEEVKVRYSQGQRLFDKRPRINSRIRS